MTYAIIARKLAAYLQLGKRTITIETADLAALLRIEVAAHVMQEAIARYLALVPTCDYADVDDAERNPHDCAGIAEVGCMCHWCQLLDALNKGETALEGE